MRLFFGFCLLLSHPVFANSTLSTQIHKIDSSSVQGEEALVFMSDGRVGRISPFNLELIERLKSAQETNQLMKLTLSDKTEILSAEEDSSKAALAPGEEISTSLLEYNSSVIKSIDEARSIFRDHRVAKEGETQCFNRAQVWAYDWRVQRNIYSNKIWIFFTAKYIRKYTFEWWFHVAPMIHVNVDGVIKERVMDMKYARGPLATKQWTDIFMKDNAACPTVITYSDHADYPETGSCFIQKTSMYFYQPIDLEFQEKFGTVKTGWVAQEVRQAYEEAFGINL